MGSLSIWHWIILAVVVAVPLTLIAKIESDDRLARGPFAVRFVSLTGAIFVPSMLTTMLPQQFAVVFALLMIPVTLIGLWSVRWAAARFQDMGLSKWLTLLYWVPLANFVVLLWQCFAGSKDAGRLVHR